MAAAEQLRMVPMTREGAPAPGTFRQDALYKDLAATYGSALDRLTRAYEANADRRRDLLQEIHVALWRSLETFDERCSLRTWVYRVAHNVGASHVVRDLKASTHQFITLAELEAQPSDEDTALTVGHRMALERLLELIQVLGPVERQVILLYLEGIDAAAIGEITGLTAGNVATKIHRLKNVLAKRFHEGQHHE